ncbi:MAG: hypothetical protein ACTSVG_01495 [Alphaproteobacteria bacterium]
MRRTAALAAIAAMLALGGCSMFSSDTEDAAAAAAQAAARYVPVETVRHIEIGRTRDGYVITAHAVAPGLGHGAPELRARRDGKVGPDGFIDFDFVAQAPDSNLNLGQGSVPARMVRADLHVAARDLQGAVGIRIHGVSGGLQMLF